MGIQIAEWPFIDAAQCFGSRYRADEALCHERRAETLAIACPGLESKVTS